MCLFETEWLEDHIGQKLPSTESNPQDPTDERELTPLSCPLIPGCV